MSEFLKRNRNALFFYVIAAVVMLWNLGVNPLWASEDRWAEIARNMVLSGDWLHPAINGTVYFDKPLLSYWPIAILSCVTGVMNEFIVRLPCVLAMFLALWATRDLAKQVTGKERAADYAGWILLTSFGVMFWTRYAAADVLNLAMVVWAVGWFYRCRERASFWSYLVFYLICFAGILAKGLPALILPPCIALALVIMDGTWKKHLVWRHFAAIPFGVLLAFASFYAAAVLPMPDYYIQPDHGLSGLGLVWRENVVRVFQPFDHDDEPFFCYFWHVPRIMAPWILATVAALAANVTEWKKLPLSRRWLWIASAVIFILFSASGSRRWYYILPIAPFLAIATAAWFTEGERWSELIRKCYTFVGLIAGIVALFGGIAVLLVLRWCGDMETALQTLGVLTMISVLVAAAAVVIVVHRNRNWAGVTAAVVIITALIFDVIIPETGRRLRTEKPFALEFARMVHGVPESDMFFFEKEAPKLTFYMNAKRPVRLLANGAALEKLLAERAGDSVYLITSTRPRTLEALFKVLPNLETQEPFLAEARLPQFEKPNARKWVCWKIAIPAKSDEK